MKNRLNLKAFIALSLLGCTTNIFATETVSSPLIIEGAWAGLYFNDTSNSGADIIMLGDTNFFAMTDPKIVGGMLGQVFFSAYTSENTNNSIKIETNGDVSFADGNVTVSKSNSDHGQLILNNSSTKWSLGGHKDGPIINPFDKQVEAEAQAYDLGIIIPIPPIDLTTYSFKIQQLNLGNDNVVATPLQIRRGAPTNSLFVSSTGNVGLGTSSPAAKLHVKDTINSTEQIVTELATLSLNNTNASGFSDTGFKLENIKEGVAWSFRTLEEDALMGSVRNGFAISQKGSGAKELVLTRYDSPGGMELILGNGAKNTGGDWVTASSRTLKENIKTLDTETAVAAFSKLQPVTYNYKSNKNEMKVGFIAEDVPELVAMNSRDGLSTMDITAVLTSVLAETRAELKIAQEKIGELEEKVSRNLK